MLVCARCGSGMIATTREWVSRHGWTIRRRCLKCGRDKIEDTGSNSHDTSQLQTGEKIAKEKTMSKSGICKFEGCTKKILAGGYCYRHYKEVNGHPYKGGQKNHKGGNIEMPGKVVAPPEPEMVTIELHSEGPFVIVKLEPETIEALKKRAKAEYRTPELEAAYILSKELSKSNLDDTPQEAYQLGSGRRPA